mmetsp:Transcript_23816/g.51790  ORF Transcript_23816/g.51790 Transcript_23816/m.51790 type:complete len:223 (+) Transcript_23816:1008-1676(+)
MSPKSIPKQLGSRSSLPATVSLLLLTHFHAYIHNSKCSNSRKLFMAWFQSNLGQTFVQERVAGYLRDRPQLRSTDIIVLLNLPALHKVDPYIVDRKSFFRKPLPFLRDMLLVPGMQSQDISGMTELSEKKQKDFAATVVSNLQEFDSRLTDGNIVVYYCAFERIGMQVAHGHHIRLNCVSTDAILKCYPQARTNKSLSYQTFLADNSDTFEAMRPLFPIPTE